MGDIISILADLRNRSEEYNTHIISIRYQKIETTTSVR